MITAEDDNGETVVKAGEYVLARITAAANKAAVLKFVALCKEQEAQLMLIGREYAEKVAWNSNNRGKARNWPIFGQRERIINDLYKRAGIKDT